MTIAVQLSTDYIVSDARKLPPKYAVIDASSSGNNTIVAAVAGKKIRVLSYVLSFSGSVNVKWQSAAGGTDISKLLYGAAGVSFNGSFSPAGHLQTAVGELLNLNLSAATAVGGHLTYIEV